MTRPLYRVLAIRSDGWWALLADLREVNGREIASQARRLDQADRMIRDAIALVLDVPHDSFEVDIVPVLRNEKLMELAHDAAEKRARFTKLEEELGAVTVEAVRRLREQGLPVRDVARLIGLTPGRVSQIERAAQKQVATAS
jgi:hypothetical protein